MLMPTWLSLMSWNSLFCVVPSSTAKMWLLVLPLFWSSSSPKPLSTGLATHWRNSCFWQQRRPCHQHSLSVWAEMMPKTKVTEKDCTLPLGDLRNWRGFGYGAWPLRLKVPLVSSRSPSGLIVAGCWHWSPSGRIGRPHYNAHSKAKAHDQAKEHNPFARHVFNFVFCVSCSVISMVQLNAFCLSVHYLLRI